MHNYNFRLTAREAEIIHLVEECFVRNTLNFEEDRRKEEGVKKMENNREMREKIRQAFARGQTWEKKPQKSKEQFDERKKKLRLEEERADIEKIKTKLAEDEFSIDFSE